MRYFAVFGLIGLSVAAFASHRIIGTWKWAEQGMTWVATFTSDGRYEQKNTGSLPAFDTSGTYTISGNTIHLHTTWREVKTGGQDLKEKCDIKSKETVTWKDNDHITLRWTGDGSPTLTRQH